MNRSFFSKRVGVVIFLFCVLLTVILILPSNNYLFPLATSTFINDSYHIRQNFQVDRFVSLLRLLRTFSVNQNNPLFLLDPKVLDCLPNFRNCVSALLEIESYLIFGYLTPNGGWKINDIIKDAFASSEFVVSQNSTHDHFVLTDSDEGSTVRVVLAKVESRSDYWFVDNIPFIGKPAFAFAKTDRINTVDVADGVAQLILPNEPLARYRRRLDQSTFLECNRTVSNSVRKLFPAQYGVSAIIPDTAVNSLAYLRDLLFKVNVTPILSGGTLLGWYRDCGLIPHTTDLDVSVLASDYNDQIELALKNDKALKLYWRLGKPSDSLEYSVYAGSVKIDIFFIYPSSDSQGTWVGGMIVGSKTKLRWTYPKLEKLCTADLKGHLFNVPCNVEAFLQADYGLEWHVPHHSKDFIWYQSHKNVQQVGQWSANEWHEVYHMYDSRGRR